MANTAQAKKRARQADSRRDHNTGQRSQARTAIKQVLTALDGEDKAAAQKAYQNAVSVLDTMVGKGILHRNAAARHKSRLNTRLRAMN